MLQQLRSDRAWRVAVISCDTDVVIVGLLVSDRCLQPEDSLTIVRKAQRQQLCMAGFTLLVKSALSFAADDNVVIHSQW